MQMRFDGRLGFPGGFVDKTDASLEDALLREVSEEMGDLPCGFQFLPEDYLFAFRCEEKRYCLHFYSKEVTFSEFLSIETRNEKQPFEGFEVWLFFQVLKFRLNRSLTLLGKSSHFLDLRKNTRGVNPWN